MCKMKNASFFLELKEPKVACRNLPCLYDFCGHLKLRCLRKTPSKGRYKFKTFINTFGRFLIFDVRKTKEEKNNGCDRNVIPMPRLNLKNFLASRDG